MPAPGLLTTVTSSGPTGSIVASSTPCVWFELVLAHYPVSSGTTIYRWANRPMSDPGSFKEGRLLSLSPIRRSCTDKDGNYRVSEVRVTVDDQDGFVRGLLAMSSTHFFWGREGGVYLLSESGRAGGYTPRTLHRGSIVKVEPGTTNRTVVLTVRDLIGSSFGAFDLDKEIGVDIGPEHTNLPPESQGFIYPMITGEHSDLGKKDVNGNSAEKGKLPVIDTGDYDISGGSTPITYLGAPTNLAVTVFNTDPSAPTEDDYYSVTAINAYGESIAAIIVKAPGAAVTKDASNRNDLTWDPVVGATSYRVWGRSHGVQVVTWLAVTTATSYSDVGTQERSGIAPQIPNAPTSGNIFGRLVCSIGATDVHEVYASDLNPSGPPKRVKINGSPDLITPSDPAWPHPEPFVIIGGIQQTVIYLRGPMLKAHRDRTVTVAWNGCGEEEVGDGSGDMIDEAFPAGMHFLNEHVFRNGGHGYRYGNWGPIETYTNGDPQLQTTAWADAQALTAMRGSSSRGYIAAWAIVNKITVREWVRRFCLTFNCRIAANHFGEIVPVLLNEFQSPTAGRVFREKIEVARFDTHDLAHGEIENLILASYDFDTDAGEFIYKDIPFENSTSIAALTPGGVVGSLDRRGERKVTHELWFTNDTWTATNSRQRRLEEYATAPRYVGFGMDDFLGLETELGQAARFTHSAGMNDDRTPLCILECEVDPLRGTTSLLGRDVEALL